jgi:putative DNA primase/helicase
MSRLVTGRRKRRNRASASPAVAQWPEPQPVPRGRPPVPRFDDALLPEALRSWVADVAGRMQCPPDFVAVGIIVSVAAVVGRKIAIRPKRQDDWAVVPNLWGLAVGPPGLMKSPALAEALRRCHGWSATPTRSTRSRCWRITFAWPRRGRAATI